jgi:hypothetical protein
MLEYISPYLTNFRPSESDLSSLFKGLELPVELPYRVVPWLALLFTIGRYAFQLLAAKILLPWVQVQRPGDTKEALAQRNSEGVYKLCYYTFSWLWAVSIVAPLGTWQDTRLCIQDYPYERSYSINAYYLWELGFYISALFTHFTLETRRKDFVEMAIHHVVTIGLIYFSHSLHLERLGLLVLLVHDVADIFLEAAKLLECVGLEFLATLCFSCLLIVWPVSRMYYFPVKIIRSWMVEHQPMNVPYYTPFLIALFVLQALHIYWFILIIKVALRKIFKGKISDVREDSVVENNKKK